MKSSVDRPERTAAKSARIFWLPVFLVAGLLTGFECGAQIDPKERSLVELGYEAPLIGQGPLAGYAYYYYNTPSFLNTNTALRLVIAPVYFDGEVGFKHLLSPTTDVGVEVNGGGYEDDYDEVRQGKYLKAESFNGYGGGGSLNVYQLLDPGRLIPLNFVAKGGFHYATYDRSDVTANNFVVPDDQITPFARVGLRFGGNEPVLFPDLGMELSIWYEQQWRPDHEAYGFDDDRSLNASSGLYWLYAGLNYAFTNIGQNVSIAMTAAGSSDADRFSAWRLGGMLPLATETPLMIPGYYAEELTARQFVHFYGAYEIPLDSAHRWHVRLEAATARLDYLASGFAQANWQSGVGGGISFEPKRKNFKVMLRYGYGFNAIRDGGQGGQSVGLVFQYNFAARKTAAAD